MFGLISFAGYASAADDYNQLVRAKGLQGDYNFFALYEVVALPPRARARGARGRPAVSSSSTGSWPRSCCPSSRPFAQRAARSASVVS